MFRNGRIHACTQSHISNWHKQMVVDITLLRLLTITDIFSMIYVSWKCLPRDHKPSSPMNPTHRQIGCPVFPHCILPSHIAQAWSLSACLWASPSMDLDKQAWRHSPSSHLAFSSCDWQNVDNSITGQFIINYYAVKHIFV